ncbi:MAG: hypothetical protein ACR2HQ_09240 [Ilumatobacteraceae bacterium]
MGGGTVTAQEQALLRALQATFPVLDQWRDLLCKPFVPVDSSDLAVDDQDWRWLQPGQLAWAGLSSARDHLHAVRVHIEARELFPVAQSTLIRAGLVGGATTVWLLAPSGRHERLRRSRVLLAETYRRHDQFNTKALELPTDQLLPGATPFAAHIRNRLGEVQAKRDADGQRGGFVQTDVIHEAALVVFPHNPAAVTEIDLIWQSTSGAAHGLTWSLFGQPDSTLVSEPDESGMAWFAVAGGLQRIANSYLGVFQLALRGWQLLAARSGIPYPVTSL